MDILMALATIFFALLIVSFVGYAYMTNAIIRDQEREIAKLRTENFRLQAKLKNRSNVRVVEIHDNRISEENIPIYGDM